MPVSPDLLARVPLAPVLAAQAVLVRRRALVLTEPPGPRTGVAGDGPGLRLLIVGDSSAAGVGAPTQDAALSGRLVAELGRRYRVAWRLEARTGATTGTALDSLSRLDPERFDVAVIALGVNDVTRLVPRRVWAARQAKLHDLLSDRFGAARIVASGLPPMGQFPLLPQPLRWVLGAHAARLDTALADMAPRRTGLVHVPMDMPFDPRYVAEDGFHPSPAGYAEWARVLAGKVAGG